MTYAFFSRILDQKLVDRTMNNIEYAPHLDEHWDPYSIVHNVSHISLVLSVGMLTDHVLTRTLWHIQVPGADQSQSLGECVGPAGYEFTCNKE